MFRGNFGKIGVVAVLLALLSLAGPWQPSPALAQSSDPIKEALAGCGVITFDVDAQGFRTASTLDDRNVNSGPHDAPYSPDGSRFFRWEGTLGNPAGHLRADDMDGQYQEVWTPVFTDSNFSELNGQQLQFDYRNDTGYNQYRLYIAVRGTNGSEYYYYFNDQLGSPGSWSRVRVPMIANLWHTGFEASENPSSPPDSPAPTQQAFAAVLTDLSRISISAEGMSGPDTSRLDNFGRACDWGDLPESGTSYVTTGDNAARHNISELLRLGSQIDTEPQGQPTTDANGDDTNFSNDDDGAQRVSGKAGSGYWTDGGVANGEGGAVSVRITGTGSGVTACLGVFMDFNNNGDFAGAGETVQLLDTNGNAIPQPIAASASFATYYFDVPADTFAGTAHPIYSRFRVTSPVNGSCSGSTAWSPTGRASDGEVEDYVWSFGPNAVQVATFSAQPAGFGEWLAQLWRMLTGR